MVSDDERKFRERMSKLVAALRETQAKSYAQLEAVEALLAEQPTIGQQTAALMKRWADRWTAKYREPYVFAVPKRDAGIFKRFIERIGFVAVDARMEAYLGDRDPFIVKNKHSLGLFINGINRLIPTKAERAQEPCQHLPRCASTWSHAKLLEAEATGDPELIAGRARMNAREAEARK